MIPRDCKPIGHIPPLPRIDSESAAADRAGTDAQSLSQSLYGSDGLGQAQG
jgi:hypothetical protein